jgi:hypothetical protein
MITSLSKVMTDEFDFEMDSEVLSVPGLPAPQDVPDETFAALVEHYAAVEANLRDVCVAQATARSRRAHAYAMWMEAKATDAPDAELRHLVWAHCLDREFAADRVAAVLERFYDHVDATLPAVVSAAHTVPPEVNAMLACQYARAIDVLAASLTDGAQPND